MDSAKSPQRKSNQFYFCVRVTPKALSKSIFESKGIQSLYKLQIYKGSRKETSQTMKRNLHQQALQGFYRSQSCYFTLMNYTNFRPYQMKITFSQINSMQQEQSIFDYKFSTYGVVKNFLQNGVRRTTHVRTIDFQTQYFIDIYIQNNKNRLEQKVKYDSTKQILNKKHLKQVFDDKDSDVFKKSVTSNGSPSKSSFKDSSALNYKIQKGLLTARTSTPLNTQTNSSRKSLILDDIFDVRSQKLSHSKSGKNLREMMGNFNKQKAFIKKLPSKRLSYDDFLERDDQDRIRQGPILPRIQKVKSIKNQRNHEENIKMYEKKIQNKKQKLDEKQRKEFDLKVFMNFKDISMDEMSYKIKKNIITIIFISIIFFIVVSRALDSISLQGKQIRKSSKVQFKQDKDYDEQRDFGQVKNDKKKKRKRIKEQQNKNENSRQQKRKGFMKK